MPLPPSRSQQRRCTACKEVKDLLTSFRKNSQTRSGASWVCRKCVKDKFDRCMDDPRYRMWDKSKERARERGIPHTIRPSDITLPEFCPLLGVRIDYRRARDKGAHRTWDGPSIDRKDSSLGYIPGNVQVLSDLANRMKQDATPEQLRAFARGVFSVYGEDDD